MRFFSSFLCTVTGCLAMCGKTLREYPAAVAARAQVVCRAVTAGFLRLAAVFPVGEGRRTHAHPSLGMPGILRHITPAGVIVICAVLLTCAITGAFLVSGSRESGIVRMRASAEAIVIDPDLRQSGGYQGRYLPDTGAAVVRGRASTTSPSPSGPGSLPRAYGVIALDEDGVSFATIDGEVFVQRLQAAAPLFQPNANPSGGDFFAPVSRATASSGEPLDSKGRPLRWFDPASADPIALWEHSLRPPRAESTEQSLYRAGGVRGLGSGSPFSAGGAVRVTRYRELVEQYARKYQLTPGLVLAIMRVESNFNPAAVSPNNALGLMQVVQNTAGSEVYSFLTGRSGEPSMETLFNPESNIRYGTAYLHLLARRYFSDVANPASREMCVIAAYNGGPGAVLRVFHRDSELAVAAINALTPEQLYETLVNNLPTAESRRYLEVVLSHARDYAR